MAPLRVVVVDDSLLIRAGVAQVLREAGLEVVGELPDAVDLMDTIESTGADAVVLDVRMPPTRSDEGIQAARAIRRRFPSVGVLVLSAFAEPEYVHDLLGDGSDHLGYLNKERVADREDFVAAIRLVCGGGTALDPSVVGLLVAGATAKEATESGPGRDALMVSHAATWARDHGCGVAREVQDGFVAVMPDGRHSHHAHFYEALDWLDAQGAQREGGP